ncbi:MAG: hypothetical protein OHK0017_13770 [Patescibacteria group bacterium]
MTSTCNLELFLLVLSPEAKSNGIYFSIELEYFFNYAVIDTTSTNSGNDQYTSLLVNLVPVFLSNGTQLLILKLNTSSNLITALY